MLMITGDTHRDFCRVGALCDKLETTTDDVLIILGDAGINYYGDRDKQLKRVLTELPITIFCIHGNHECRPESIGTYSESAWCGGTVYIEPEFPNLLFAKDGDIYDIGGKKCIVIGGAYSVDKTARIMNDWGWWDDEQPSEEIKRRVEHQLEVENWCVDVVLTHTAPLKYEPREVFIGGIDDSEVDKSTEIWLDSIEDRLEYNRWYCGHYHTNKSIDKMCFLFDDFLEFR